MAVHQSETPQHTRQSTTVTGDGFSVWLTREIKTHFGTHRHPMCEVKKRVSIGHNRLYDLIRGDDDPTPEEVAELSDVFHTAAEKDTIPRLAVL